MQEVDIVSFQFSTSSTIPTPFSFLSTWCESTAHKRREGVKADPKDLLCSLQEIECTFHSFLAEMELTEAILIKVF